jgi:death-on-curing protein
LEAKIYNPTLFEKAAALAQSLIVNHPFVDGNKRTGILAMLSLLINNQYLLKASSDDLYNFAINISTGALSFDGIVEWLKANTVMNKINEAY